GHERYRPLQQTGGMSADRMRPPGPRGAAPAEDRNVASDPRADDLYRTTLAEYRKERVVEGCPIVEPVRQDVRFCR
ncbi:MAG TPA: hypothetical protein VIY28_00315, partial [Pseudonocardiaceae bacterium]